MAKEKKTSAKKSKPKKKPAPKKRAKKAKPETKAKSAPKKKALTYICYKCGWIGKKKDVRTGKIGGIDFHRCPRCNYTLTKKVNAK